MELFQWINYKLEIKPEVFTITIFKEIVDRDKSKDKKIGLQELAYIYHMCDNSSPYSAILDSGRRHEEICKRVIKTQNWKPDSKVNEAITVYKELDETITSRFLDSVKIALSKVDNYLRNFDEKSAESADITRINTMIEKSIDTVKSVRELEKLVLQDKESSNLLRGGRERGMYLDDSNQ